MARIDEYPTTSEFSFRLGTADVTVSSSVRLWENNGTVGPAETAALDDPNHPPVEIAGITWGWNDFESSRITHIGAFGVSVYGRRPGSRTLRS